MSPVLVFDRVSVRYQPQEPCVLEQCSFSVAAGERVALLGLNGCGKTTALLAATGLLPFEGAIEVDGIVLGPTTAVDVRKRLGFLFSSPDHQLLFPRVVDDVAFGPMRHGESAARAQEQARVMLEELGVGEHWDHSPFHLSHGQRQRVALAGVLVTDPAVLLLDEPTLALDPPGRRSLAAMLRSRSTAMLIATHDIAFAMQTCARFLVFRPGAHCVDEVTAPEAQHCLDAQQPLRSGTDEQKPASPGGGSEGATGRIFRTGS